MKKIVFAIILSLFFKVWAQEASCDLSLEKSRIALSEETVLKLTFYNVSNIPVLEVPQISGFNLVYLGPTSTASVIKGNISSSMSYAYSLKPNKAGKFNIGPLVFNFNGVEFKTNSVEIEVLGGAVAVSEKEEVDDISKLIGDRAFVTVSLSKNELYLYELFSVKVKLFLNSLYAQDVEYPQLRSDGFTINEFSPPEKYKEEVNGVSYDVVEFKTSGFAIKTGEAGFGPAILNCAILAIRKPEAGGEMPFIFKEPFFEDSVNDYIKYPLTLKSHEIPVNVSPLPNEGRPADFTGAIGDFGLKIHVEKNKFIASSPVIVKMVISGKGNFNSVRSPSISSAEGFKVYSPIAKAGQGFRVFEQIIIPLNSFVKRMPEFIFSYFNPDQKKYYTITEGGGAVTVAESGDAREAKEPFAKEEGEGIVYIKTELKGLEHRRERMPDFTPLLVPVFGPLFALICAKFYARRFNKLRFNIKYYRFCSAAARARKGLRKAKSLLSDKNQGDFYAVIYKAMREYTADKLGMPSAGVTLYEISGGFSGHDLSPDMVREIESIFNECDRARYSVAKTPLLEMRRLLARSERALKFMEKAIVFKEDAPRV